VIAALGVAIAYIDRANLGVAIPFMRKDLHLDPALQGIILSSFFWTYAVSQLPSGWLLDRLGPRIMFAAAAAWWGLFTAATALARGFGSLIGFRLALGAGEGPMMPSNAKVVSQWFPRRERAFASSIFNSGTESGAALALPICAALIGFGGWQFSFVVTGLLGILWAIGWFWFYRAPRQHRLASEAEADYIEQDSGHADESTPSDPLRWRDLLRYRTVWGMILAYICRACCVYFFITWFPSYLLQAHHLSLKQLGFLGAIPGIFSILASWVGGWFCDHLVRRGVRIGLARKIPLVGGMLGSSVIALAGLASSVQAALILLTISYGCSSFAGGAVWSLPADVSPTPGNVGSLAGLQNCGSQIGGIFGPILVGFLISFSGGFALPLVTIGCITVLGALIYGLMVKIEPLPARPIAGTATK
jgi:ACS family glucarate transporter-like MFS transporter